MPDLYAAIKSAFDRELVQTSYGEFHKVSVVHKSIQAMTVTMYIEATPDLLHMMENMIRDPLNDEPLA